MAARSRPRTGAGRDDGAEHEEQQMWESIKSDLRKLAAIQKRQIEVHKSIEELEREAAESSRSKYHVLQTSTLVFIPALSYKLVLTPRDGSFKSTRNTRC